MAQAIDLGPAVGPAVGGGAPPATGGGMGVRRPVLIGLAIIAVFFGGFGLWAAIAPLDSAAIAPGVVIVDSKRKTIQHLEGGIVAEILVQEGSEVVPGDPLIRLDETQQKARLELLRGQLVAFTALESRLQAERDGRDGVDFPGWLLDRGIDAKAADAMAGELRIFEARAQSLSGQTSILEQRIGQLRQEIEGLQGEVVAGDRQLELIRDEIADKEMLLAKGLQRKPQLLALQREEADVMGERARNISAIARARQRIGETRLQIDDLRSTRLNEVVQELRNVQTELQDIRERIWAAEDVLHRTEVVAPVAGTVVDLQVVTNGAVISGGQPLLDIVPKSDSLIVEAQIDPNDIDVVTLGLPAQIRFSAFAQRTAPTFTGRVSQVSADRLEDERTGMPYYSAQVTLDEGQGLGREYKIQPGMAAETIIVTGERTLVDYLVDRISVALKRSLREQ